MVSLAQLRVVQRTTRHLHIENIHLNVITDLIISLGYNTHKEALGRRYTSDQIIELLNKSLEERKKLFENSEYIKNQNNQIIIELKEIIKDKGKYDSINTDIDKITDAINKLSIEDIKINKKPQPYKLVT